MQTALNVKTYPDLAPIVPEYMRNKTYSYKEYSAYTSKVARLVGKQLNISPLKMEYWVRNQFGAVGGFVLGKTQANPIYRTEEKFLLRGRTIDRFYDNKLLLEEHKRAAKEEDNPFTKKEIIAIVLSDKIYNQMANVLAAARETYTETKTLPEQTREDIFHILVKLDNTTIDDGRKYTVFAKDIAKVASQVGAKVSFKLVK